MIEGYVRAFRGRRSARPSPVPMLGYDAAVELGFDLATPGWQAFQTSKGTTGAIGPGGKKAYGKRAQQILADKPEKKPAAAKKAPAAKKQPAAKAAPAPAEKKPRKAPAKKTPAASPAVKNPLQQQAAQRAEYVQARRASPLLDGRKANSRLESVVAAIDHVDPRQRDDAERNASLALEAMGAEDAADFVSGILGNRIGKYELRDPESRDQIASQILKEIRKAHRVRLWNANEEARSSGGDIIEARQTGAAPLKVIEAAVVEGHRRIGLAPDLKANQLALLFASRLAPHGQKG